MNLLRLFKKEKSIAPAEPAAVIARPTFEKPASERFGKTVMPNTARVMEPDASASALSVASSPKSSSLGGTSASPSPIALRPGPAPGGQRTVALQLGELLPQIPPELLEGGEVDPAHRIVFNASELERGMANGRPAVPLRAIYQQAPTIFSSEVGAEDKREIPLPFHKVLEQFANLQVREDQEPDAAVPQVETPFLQVTLEDSEKFGTPMPVASVVRQSGAETQVSPSEVATALVVPSTSVPAPAVAPRAPIRLSLPAESVPAPAPAPMPAVVLPNEPEPLKSLLPVAPKIFPNGAGVPITERVPASSGSSAPIPLPAPLAPVQPPRIPFRITPPASDLCPPSALPLTPAAARLPVAFIEGPCLRLSLRNVLRGIPPFQIEGSIETVPEEARIELPFAIVQPQLSLGRVAISPAQFQAAMPEEFRSLYKVDEGGIPVSLPLAEILQNLPDDSIQIREDQEEVQFTQLFETPFSQKAAEDAARLKMPAGQIAKPAAPTPEAATPVAPKTEAPADSLPAPSPAPAPTISEPAELPLSASPGETRDGKSVVSQLSQLAGIKACAVMFSDGLSLAGNLPSEYEADALCAMAPEIMKRIDQQMVGANLGDLHALTIFCAKAPVSFFSAGDICLAALHSTADISAEIRGQLGRATQELARIYAQPVSA